MSRREESPTATLYEVRDERGIVIGQDFHLAPVTCATVFTEPSGDRIGAWFPSERAARDCIALCRRPCRVLAAKPAEPPPVPRKAGKKGNPFITREAASRALQEAAAGTPVHVLAKRMGVKVNTLYRAMQRARERNDNESERKAT